MNDWQIKGIALDKKEELHNLLDELINVSGKDGFSYGAFLWDLIGKYADEGALTKMIEDTRKHLNLLLAEPDKIS